MKKTIATLSVSLLCAGAWAQPVPVYDAADKEYYQVMSDPGDTWINAENLALGTYYTPPVGPTLEGHLVTITSADEDSFVGNLVIAVGLSGEVWAGGYQNPANDPVAGDGWTWVNNEGTFPGVDSSSPYANWNPGEPNDAGGPGSEQFLGLNLNSGDIGGFNDEGNLSLIAGYVIEYDPNTVPGGGLAPGYVPDAASTAGLLSGAVTLLGLASRRLRK